MPQYVFFLLPRKITAVAAAAGMFVTLEACSGAAPDAQLFAPDPSGVDASTDKGHGGLVIRPDAGPDAPSAIGRDASGAADAAGGKTPDAGGGGVCGAAAKSCGGVCVALDEPRFGCASATCQSCVVAGGTATCSAGACAIQSCSAAFGDCNQSASDGCETNLQTNPQSCGACTNRCAQGDVCSAGVCQHSCGNGLTTCGQSCVNLSTNTLNCGGCGNTCPGTANGSPTCANFQCGIVCAAGYHVCNGVCVSSFSIATCGASCSACPTPLNGSPTCDGTTCGATCNAGSHACGSECLSNTSTLSCGASCTACPVPVNASATCNGSTCGSQCLAGSHLCGSQCAANTSAASCGTSCTPCVPPANATSICSPASACDFVCNPGWKRNGSVCEASPLPTLTIAPAVAGVVADTFTFDAAQAIARPGASDVCPNALLDTFSVTPFQYVTLRNASFQTATVSIWTAKALTAGAADIDTLLATYATPPATTAEREACQKGVNDRCTVAGTTDPTECVGEWAGLTRANSQQVTVPALGSITVYVAAYFAPGSAGAPAATGPFRLNVRTETLQ